MSRNRPFGITVLAILAILSGIVQGLVALGVLGIGGLAAVFGGPIGIGFGLLAIPLALIFALVPLLYIAFGVGALNLRPWAWWLGVLASVLSVGGMVLQLLSGDPPGFFRAVFGVLVLIYLLSRDVRRAFGT